MITEAYCSYEVAKLLKEKGFDEPCRTYWTYNDKDEDGKEEWYFRDLIGRSFLHNSELDIDEINAPTHQMALAWLRENYNLLIYADISFDKWEGRIKHIHNKDFVEGTSFLSIGCFLTYERAIEAALKYSLENLI